MAVLRLKKLTPQSKEHVFKLSFVSGGCLMKVSQ